MGLWNWLCTQFGRREPQFDRALAEMAEMGFLFRDNRNGAYIFSPGMAIAGVWPPHLVPVVPEPKQFQRPTLYLFQHSALRKAAFDNHPELARAMTSWSSSISLTHFWSAASLECRRCGWDQDEGWDDEQKMEEEDELQSAMKLSKNTQAGFTAYVVSMPAPRESPEAYFVAIVHKDDEPHEYREESPSTRYFTLERSDQTQLPMLCEWHRDESRTNYGEGPRPDLDEFTSAVFDRVFGGGTENPSRPVSTECYLCGVRLPAGESSRVCQACRE